MNGKNTFWFKEIDKVSWDKQWQNVNASPLLQSWEYGEAKSLTQRFRAKRFLLRRGEDVTVGLLQALMFDLPLIGGVARINRGPVFFDHAMRTSITLEEAHQVFLAIKELSRQQHWRLLRLAPEFLDTARLDPVLLELGFVKRQIPAAVSAVIDIKRSLDDIRAGFHSKWRNLLKKSEKMELKIESPPVREAIGFLIDKYSEMQQDKGFVGVPTKLLSAMSEQSGTSWRCRIFFALHEGKREGAVMVVGHGDTCTYLVGWTSPEGRRLQANYILLWEAILLFKELGYAYFDVGGLGQQTTVGVEHFKQRMKGEEYRLIGEYSYSPIPFVK